MEWYETPRCAETARSRVDQTGVGNRADDPTVWRGGGAVLPFLPGDSSLLLAARGVSAGP